VPCELAILFQRRRSMLMVATLQTASIAIGDKDRLVTRGTVIADGFVRERRLIREAGAHQVAQRSHDRMPGEHCHENGADGPHFPP